MLKNFTPSNEKSWLFDLELPMNRVRGNIKVQKIIVEY